MASFALLVCECLLSCPAEEVCCNDVVAAVRKALCGLHLALHDTVAVSCPVLRSVRIADIFCSKHVPQDCGCISMHSVAVSASVAARAEVHLYSFAPESSIAVNDSPEFSDSSSDQPFDAISLPTEQHDLLWSRLHFDNETHSRLLNTISAFIHCADCPPLLVSSVNRILLLHGPPGSGKSSLARALFNTAAIRHGGKSFVCLEINCQSIFSRWFSESPKQIAALFSRIHALASRPAHFVFLLLDEVESLVLARSTSLDAGEPADSMRAVNALLTQLDKTARFPNIISIATTNICSAIDPAFLSRLDLAVEIPPPSFRAAYSILAESFSELSRCGLVRLSESLAPFSSLLLSNSDACSSASSLESLVFQIRAEQEQGFQPSLHQRSSASVLPSQHFSRAPEALSSSAAETPSLPGSRKTLSALIDSLLSQRGESETLFEVARCLSSLRISGRSLRKAPFVAYTARFQKHVFPVLKDLLVQLLDSILAPQSVHLLQQDFVHHPTQPPQK